MLFPSYRQSRWGCQRAEIMLPVSCSPFIGGQLSSSAPPPMRPLHCQSWKIILPVLGNNMLTRGNKRGLTASVCRHSGHVRARDSGEISQTRENCQSLEGIEGQKGTWRCLWSYGESRWSNHQSEVKGGLGGSLEGRQRKVKLEKWSWGQLRRASLTQEVQSFVCLKKPLVALGQRKKKKQKRKTKAVI